MAVSVDYKPTLTKLLEKSEQGRIPWEEIPGSATRFQCTIENAFSFLSWKYDTGYGIRMSDDRGTEIFKLTTDEEVYFSSPEAEALFNTVRDIYEAAHRKALNVDQKLESVSSLLDKF